MRAAGLVAICATPRETFARVFIRLAGKKEEVYASTVNSACLPLSHGTVDTMSSAPRPAKQKCESFPRLAGKKKSRCKHNELNIRAPLCAMYGPPSSGTQSEPLRMNVAKRSDSVHKERMRLHERPVNKQGQQHASASNDGATCPPHARDLVSSGGMSRFTP